MRPAKRTSAPWRLAVNEPAAVTSRLTVALPILRSRDAPAGAPYANRPSLALPIRPSRRAFAPRMRSFAPTSNVAPATGAPPAPVTRPRTSTRRP